MAMPTEGSVSSGDFERFFRAEHPRLLPVAVALTGSRDIAHDLVQDAMLRTFRAWPTVAGLERPGAWTRRVLINLCVDAHRRRSREHRALERAPRPGTADMPDPQTAAFWAAVRALPALQRAVVALHYLDDLSVVDVGATLNVSVGTVKTSLSRARRALAHALAIEED
jgi:RNA polymerase sigma-70 factor (ECF subfamily)